jgi:hypothetical protein
VPARVLVHVGVDDRHAAGAPHVELQLRCRRGARGSRARAGVRARAQRRLRPTRARVVCSHEPCAPHHHSSHAPARAPGRCCPCTVGAVSAAVAPCWLTPGRSLRWGVGQAQVEHAAAWSARATCCALPAQQSWPLHACRPLVLAAAAAGPHAPTMSLPRRTVMRGSSLSFCSVLLKHVWYVGSNTKLVRKL